MLTLKKIAIAVTVPVILSTTWACSSGEKNATEHHVQTDTLRADSIAIHEILNPWKLMEKNGMAILHNLPEKDTLFYVYSLPDFRFLYKWGRVGQGPDEFINPSFIPSVGDDIYISTWQSTCLYSLSPEGVTLKERIVPKKRVQTDAVFRNSTAEYISWNPAENYLYLRNIHSEDVIDSVKIPWAFKNFSYGNTNTQQINVPHIAAVSSWRMAVAFEMMDALFLYDIDENGRMTPVDTVGTLRFPKEISDYVNDESRTEFKMDDTDIYFNRITSTDDGHIFAEYYGMPSRLFHLTKKTSTHINVYDADGKMLKRLILDKPCGLWIADSRTNTIYGINPHHDFEYVYTFKYEL